MSVIFHRKLVILKTRTLVIIYRVYIWSSAGFDWVDPQTFDSNIFREGLGLINCPTGGAKGVRKDGGKKIWKWRGNWHGVRDKRGNWFVIWYSITWPVQTPWESRLFLPMYLHMLVVSIPGLWRAHASLSRFIFAITKSIDEPAFRNARWALLYWWYYTPRLSTLLLSASVWTYG